MVHSTAESDMTEATQHACMDLLGLFIYLTIKVIKDQGTRCTGYFTWKWPGSICTILDKILALLNREGNPFKQKGNFSKNMNMQKIHHVLQINRGCFCSSMPDQVVQTALTGEWQ